MSGSSVYYDYAIVPPVHYLAQRVRQSPTIRRLVCARQLITGSATFIMLPSFVNEHDLRYIGNWGGRAPLAILVHVHEVACVVPNGVFSSALTVNAVNARPSLTAFTSAALPNSGVTGDARC